MTHPQSLPPKSLINSLQEFDGLTMKHVVLVHSERQAGEALEVLTAARHVGFDTESKPTFLKGEQSEGPHVLQFATLEKAYIFQASFTACRPAILTLLQSPAVVKIGFGLSGDLRQIARRFQIQPAAMVDLDRFFKQLGYRNTLGAKSAVALMFKRRLLKSKSITTSNWAAANLSERQLLYAANDAFAALRVFHALRSENERSPDGGRGAPDFN